MTIKLYTMIVIFFPGDRPLMRDRTFPKNSISMAFYKYFWLSISTLLFTFVFSCHSVEEKKHKELVVVMKGDVDGRKLSSSLRARDAMQSKNKNGLSGSIITTKNNMEIIIVLDGGQDEDEVMKSAIDLIKLYKLEKKIIEISIR